ncbi:MAG: Flp pilus assembly protein CpaB [Amnibacterium sp.]
MKIRLLAALTALVLAVLGAVLINGYVQGADARALAGVRTEDVLVVAKPVPAGTAVGDLAASVQPKAVPATAVATGALSSLDGLKGTVTSVDLVPGEQLLKSRLVSPSKVQKTGTVAVPKGMQEVTVQLSPDRVVGGRIQAGETVAVYFSIPNATGNDGVTKLVFQKVLVTDVQGAPAQSDGKSGQAAPSGSLLITLARPAADVQRIIFAAQYGTIWLSSEPADSVATGLPTVTRSDVLQ